MSTGMDLKVRRIRAKITQEQIAERVGLSRSWVAKVEREADDPTDPAVVKYVAALRTFVDVTEAA